MTDVLTPQDPVKIALIGSGNRASAIYRPLFEPLSPWVELVAVCDPVKEHADRIAAALEVPAFYDIYELVRAKPMEAALVVTPVDSHHSISCYLSSNGVHNMVETSMANMVVQGRQMIDSAVENKVIHRVAENFFRKPVDRIVQKIMEAKVLGRIGRIFSYADHTGYHNNSRWIIFAKDYPTWVQAISHTMETASFNSTPVRFHNSETFRGHYFMFPDDLLVIDQAANVKGFLGRLARPGYTEWQGEKGTVIHRSADRWVGETEVRYCVDVESHHGQADTVLPVVTEYEDSVWKRTFVDMPDGRIEYVNPFTRANLDMPGKPLETSGAYGSEVMGHIVDFSLAVRDLAEGEYPEGHALMALMMDAGTKESILREGARIRLPFEGDFASDEEMRKMLTEKNGVDPLDIEGMLAISYPKP